MSEALAALAAGPSPPPPDTSADAGAVDADNPWPGLAAFREADRAFFHGRDAEAEELARLVRRERLTVLFGLSGLGKTSLLAAGLFPRLRQEDVLPVLIRLDFSPAAADLAGQVQEALLAAAAAAGIEAPQPRPGETLWELFHRQGAEFWNARNRLVTPLLAFDQFEEVFTLGKGRAATDELLAELADLVEGRPPAALKAQLDAAPEAAREFQFGRHGYRVLLALREDFLPDLEELRDRIRTIAQNRLRLTRMDGAQALAAVTATGGRLVDAGLAEQIVRFVAGAGDAAPLSRLEIEPALLSVVCRELNDERRRRGGEKITPELLAGSRAQILAGFYERSVADLPAAVRGFVEERLITSSGFRDSVALESALELPGIASEALDRLVERRLLRVEDRGGVERIELTHDVLTGVIRASRDDRRRREAAEQAEAARREAEERARSARRQLARSRRTAAALAALLVLALGGLLWGWRSQREAQQASREVQRALADSDAADARRLAETGAMAPAFAYLARAVRLNPESVGSRSLLLDLLLHRDWALARATLRHRSDVQAARFTPDGRLLVTASADGTAGVWEAATGRLLRSLAHGGREVTACEVSPDGRLVVVASGSGWGWTVSSWELATGRRLATVPFARRPILSRHFDPTGRWLVAAPLEAPAYVLDAATGRPAGPAFGEAVLCADWSPGGSVVTGEVGSARLWDVQAGQPRAAATVAGAWVMVARFSPDGRRLLTVADRRASLWDVASGRAVGPPMVDQSAILAADFSPDSERVVTASYDSAARVWRAETGEQVFAVRHDDSVVAAGFSPKGSRLLTGSLDGTARIWDAASGSPLSQFLRHDEAVDDAEMSPDGRLVATASRDRRAIVWDVRPRRAAPLALAGQRFRDARFALAGPAILAAAEGGAARLWSPLTGQPMRGGIPPGRGEVLALGRDGREAVVATAAGLEIWDVAAGRPAAVLHPAGRVGEVELGPGGRLATAAGKLVEVWNLRTGRRAGALPHPDRVTALAWSSDGRRLATAAGPVAEVWQVAAGRHDLPSLGRFAALGGTIGILRFTPAGGRLLTVACASHRAGADDCRAQVWDVATGRPQGAPMRLGAAVHEAVFDPRGERVLTASADGWARVWDARTGEVLGEPLRHEDEALAAEFSPGGERVATGSVDGMARVWDPASGRLVAGPLPHGSPVLAVRWSPDGQRLLTVAGDGQARVWDLPTGAAGDAGLLADLAEAVGGAAIGKRGAIAAVSDPAQGLDAIRRRVAGAPEGRPTAAAVARWFLADPESRTISPFSTVRAGER